MSHPITPAQWNRTLLQRQHLLERIEEDAVEVIDRCVGLQSQDPQAAFYALASRVDGFDPAELDDLLTERELIRMALLRGTVFLMDALDARWMRELLRPVLESGTRQHVKRLRAVTPDELVEVATELVGAASDPVSASALRAELVQRWPDESPTDMAAVVRGLVPLVQTPPRGLWGRSGGPCFALLNDWIGPGDPAVTGPEATADLIRMYLRGYGPSTVDAVQTWSGLRGLGPVMSTMAADWELAEYTGPNGEKLYDLEGLALADPDEPAPVRLVAPFDTVLFTDADRIRVADPDLYSATVTPNGISPGFILVDGRLAGTWKRDGDGIALTQLRDLTDAERRDCEREAERLVDWADAFSA